jgi:hypothetical protein
MVVVLLKEGRLIVVVDDLEFGIRAIAFEAKVFNNYGTFDQIANNSMEDLGYAYLHYDLLNREALTTITLRVKFLHVEMREQHLQNGMFVKVDFFCIESKFKGVLRNVTCMLSLQLN